MTRAERSKKIGKLAEKALGRWATEAGITANQSEEDEAGWDFVLDLPFATEDEEGIAAPPLDLGAQPVQCLIQVKATDSNRRRVEIKLSNLKRLVQFPVPVFYFIAEFDGNDSPQRVFLLHVGEKIIRRTQRRLRKCAEEKGTKLHKKRLSLSYNQTHEMDAFTGVALKNALVEHTGKSAKDYARRKVHLINSVGYEEGAGGVAARFEFSLPDQYDSPEQYLSDFSLGLLPHIETQKTEIHDIRFQVPSPEPVKVLGPAKMEILGHDPKSAQVTFRAIDNSRRVRLQTQLYTNSGFDAVLGPEDRRLRFASGCVDFFISLGDTSVFSFSFDFPDYGTATPIKDLYDTAKFVLFLDACISENTNFDVEVDIASTEVSGRIGTLPASGLSEKAEELPADMAENIRNAWRVCQAFDVEMEAGPSLYQLDQQASYLEIWRSLVEGRSLHGRAYFWAERESQDDEDDISELVFAGVQAASVSIGNFRLTVVLGLLGDAEQVADEEVKEVAPVVYEKANGNPALRLQTQNVRLLKKYVSDREGPLPITREEMMKQGACKFDEAEYDHLLPIE